jgi:hypothetical protein
MSSKAGRRRVIKSDVLVVGIDVAKRRHVAAIRVSDGRTERSFSFSNDRIGFDKLLAKAEAARARYGLSGILFALESSGPYGHGLWLLGRWDKPGAYETGQGAG